MTVRNKIEKIIDKGGSVGSDKETEWTTLSLRITKQMVRDLDLIVKERPGMTRTALILEAINEKIKKQ